MSFASFFKSSVLEERLAKSQVLVVYDPDGRYRDLCSEMVTETRSVVDCTESSINSRAKALSDLRKLGSQSLEQMLIYVPVEKPLEDEDKQVDPFALYGACGAVFPDGDGDAFLSLCLKAKPDHATQVRAVFEQDPNPSFAVIDAIGGGLSWPNLRAQLKVESTQDILFALLVPNESQREAMQANDSWVAETKALFESSIGLSLKTKGKTWSPISEELWRFILFSEFIFDLPEEIPAGLNDVPRASDSAQPLIEDICDRLRSDSRYQMTYIEKAESIESDLDLPSQCAQLSDLGERDTFPFEERTFLQQAMDALSAGDTDRVKLILGRHAQSVWTGKGESQAQWDLIRSAFSLIQACGDSELVLTDRSGDMDTLIEWYVTQLREVDRLHREFEQALSDYEWQDTDGRMRPTQELARKRYVKLMDKVQSQFSRHLVQSGWPVTGTLSNADVFDKFVEPRIEQSGKRVAYLMVDALRYELGIALKQQLADEGKISLSHALSQLPSITLVGMASLLPGAGSELRLVKNDKKYDTYLGDSCVSSVAQRMDVFKKRFGQRFQEGRLEDYVRNRFDIESDTELLVLRSVEIDSHFENHPDTAPTEITNALKRIRVAVHKLKMVGFDEVVIATDHGFFMNTNAGAGDTCSKLEGDWINEHERCMLGNGSGDSNHFLLDADRAGIRGDFAKLAGPLSMASYRSGMAYYHGGASLQECVVPVITIQLDRPDQEPVSQTSVTLNYKNGAKRTTTRLPVIEIRLDNQDMFSVGSDFEILLEAHDKKGEVVGEAKPGGPVNAATGTITLKPGESVQVPLKMHMEFEGKFKVKALNPANMVVFNQLDLETDYTV